jgi:Glycosyltransferase family 87
MGARNGNWEQSRLAVYERRLMDAMHTAARSRLLQLAVVILAFGVAAFTFLQRFTPESALPCYPDFFSFYHSALGLRGGVAPYGPSAEWMRSNVSSSPFGPFTATSCLSGLFEFSYTPVLGLLFIPFTVLPYTVALLVWDGCNLLLLGGAIYAILRVAGMRPTATHLVLLTVAVTLVSPVRFALYYTQADLLLLFLICVALWMRIAGRPLLGGLLLALACAIEPALLAFVIPFLLWKREFKLAAITLGTAAAFIFVPFLWLGGQALQDLLTIWRFDWSVHGSAFTNNAPRGILLRLLTPNEYVKPLVVAPALVTPLWLLLAGVVLLVAAKLIARRPLTGDCRSLLEIGLAVAAVLLISPWSENNHFTLLLLPFLAVYALLFRLDFRLKEAHMLFWGFLGALFFAFVLGDPVQYAMVSRMAGNSPLRVLFLLLAVPYLYTLLAIAAVVLYAVRLMTSPNGRQIYAVAPAYPSDDASRTHQSRFARLHDPMRAAVREVVLDRLLELRIAAGRSTMAIPKKT